LWLLPESSSICGCNFDPGSSAIERPFGGLFILDVSCIALAGGKSTRLGRDKLSELIGGTTLLQRVVHTLSLFDCEIIIVAQQPSSLPHIASHSRIRVVRDIYPGKGALGGIYTGLMTSRSFYNLVVAADMPFLNGNLLQYMLDVAEGMDLVAYREGDRFEPLHAVYSQTCVIGLAALLPLSNVRLIEILRLAKTRYLALEEIERFDPQHISFFNINVEEDLQKARSMVTQGATN
jgi:molybdenum cofactor guanylyltransferase